MKAWIDDGRQATQLLRAGANRSWAVALKTTVMTPPVLASYLLTQRGRCNSQPW